MKHSACILFWQQGSVKEGSASSSASQKQTGQVAISKKDPSLWLFIKTHPAVHFPNSNSLPLTSEMCLTVFEMQISRPARKWSKSFPIAGSQGSANTGTFLIVLRRIMTNNYSGTL